MFVYFSCDSSSCLFYVNDIVICNRTEWRDWILILYQTGRETSPGYKRYIYLVFFKTMSNRKEDFVKKM